MTVFDFPGQRPPTPTQKILKLYLGVLEREVAYLRAHYHHNWRDHCGLDFGVCVYDSFYTEVNRFYCSDSGNPEADAVLFTNRVRAVFTHLKDDRALNIMEQEHV